MIVILALFNDSIKDLTKIRNPPKTGRIYLSVSHFGTWTSSLPETDNEADVEKNILQMFEQGQRPKKVTSRKQLTTNTAYF